MKSDRKQGPGGAGSKRLVGWTGAAFFFLGILFWLALPGQAQVSDPGGETDPLVTKSYLEQRCQDLESQVKALTQKVEALELQVAELQKKPTVASQEAVKIVLQVGSRNAYVNGEAQVLNVAPYLEGDSAMVPFRFIGEALGASVGWEGQTGTITYRLGATDLTMRLGQNSAQVNGELRKLAAAPKLTGTTTMVPLRMVAECLGAHVTWSSASKEITISL